MIDYDLENLESLLRTVAFGLLRVIESNKN